MSDRLHFQLQLPASPVSVGVARGAVRALAPLLGVTVAERSELVLSEIVTNAIRHGSPGAGGVVHIDLAVKGDTLAGEVCDEGPPFGLPDWPLGGARIGGYGLYIARQVSALHVARTGSGNAVSFTVAP